MGIVLKVCVCLYVWLDLTILGLRRWLSMWVRICWLCVLSELRQLYQLILFGQLFQCLIKAVYLCTNEVSNSTIVKTVQNWEHFHTVINVIFVHHVLLLKNVTQAIVWLRSKCEGLREFTSSTAFPSNLFLIWISTKMILSPIQICVAGYRNW